MSAARTLSLALASATLASGVCFGAEIAMVPVRATGGHAIAGNRITLYGGGQRVFLEIKVSGWDPNHDGVPKLKTWQANVDSAGYTSGSQGVLAPALVACAQPLDCRIAFGGACTLQGAACLVDTDCAYYAYGEVCRGSPCDYPLPPGGGGYCSPGFQLTGRADGVLLKEIAAVDVTSPGFRYGATLSPSGLPMVDPGTVGYGGTLVLDVPVDARGTFTIGFLTTSIMNDSDNEPIPLSFTPGQIEIRCGSGADCDDGNPCTNDACVSGSCANTPNAVPCDDGLFCNGADTCSGGNCTVHAGDPCAPSACDELNNRCLGCPDGPVTFVEPMSGTVDARQPFPPNNAAQRQGIKSIRVQGPAGINDRNCWTLCETKVDGAANAITGIVDNGNGTFDVNLARTISIGAVTTLTYTESGGTDYQGVLVSHPANVNADSTSNAVDILRVIDILNGVAPAPWVKYSCDVDHSGVCGPPDILRVIDLLNGADQLDPWLGIPLPQCGTCCP